VHSLQVGSAPAQLCDCHIVPAVLLQAVLPLAP
jgi:hypothetical protein